MKDIHYSKIYTVFVTMRGLWGSNPFSDEYPATAEFAKTGAEQPEQLEQAELRQKIRIFIIFLKIVSQIAIAKNKKYTLSTLHISNSYGF